jgi:ParB-like chromosome segregation protein Spo0J
VNKKDAKEKQMGCAKQIHWVSPDRLDLRLRHLHTPCDAAIQSMAASLEKRGQISPLIAADDGQCLILVDGFKRQAAAEAIGLAPIEVMAKDIDPLHSKAMLYLANRAKGFSMIQEAILIRELVEVDGLKQVEVATVLERHKSWVSRRLDMIRRLAPEIVEDLRLGLLPPGSVASLAQLPPCNQSDFSTAIQAHRLRPKEIHRLVELWCKAKDPAIKHFLLNRPKRALQIVCQDDTPAMDPTLVKYKKALRAIEQIASSLYRASKHAMPAMDKETAAVFAQMVNQAQRACQSGFKALQNTLEKEASP